MRISKVLMTLPLVYSLTVTAASSSPKVEAQTAPSVARTESPSTKISVEGQKLFVESKNFTAEFTGACLTSLIDLKRKTQFCRRDESAFPIELFFVDEDVLKQDKKQKIEVKPLSDLAARVVITGASTDRELFVRLDPVTGDLCVTPGGRSLRRRGLLSVRWNISFTHEADIIMPCVNGIFVENDRGFPPNARFGWPWGWNAQLVIVEQNNCSLMIHSEDKAFKYKSLNLFRNDGLTTLGFESEQVGPVWQNDSAGGVEWRLNTYEGNWKTPAKRHRGWMNRTYNLEEKRANRPKWVDDISFTLQWANADVNLLEALAKVYPPEKTLIHLSNWRTSKYDIDYPDYIPSEQAKAFMKKANDMKFKVMLHYNFWAVDINHPVFQQLRQWQVRSVARNELQGWYWPPTTYDYTQMAYIHPGSGIWRRILIDAVLNSSRKIKAPAVFLDQTFCTWNTDNGMVENMTTMEGMRQLQEEFVAIHPDIVLAGEELHEISFQRECFAQAHIFDGWGELKPHHIPVAHPICSFLWEGHTRLVGYYHLNPSDKDVDIGIEVYRRMGAIPTLICNDPKLISKDQPTVKKIIDLAQKELSRQGR
jgi:hypothetical protein